MKYSDKSLIERILFFIVGFTQPFIGYALYLLFKDIKNKEWQSEFLQRGSIFGFCFLVLIIICYIIGSYI